MVRPTDRIDRRGLVLLWAVAVYGLRDHRVRALAQLLADLPLPGATGAADTVSMVLRNIIRQLDTPDHLRGRMTGVNMIFFMGGPQLGELEAGLVAPTPGRRPVSVVTGGIGVPARDAVHRAHHAPLRRYRKDDEITLAGYQSAARAGFPARPGRLASQPKLQKMLTLSLHSVTRSCGVGLPIYFLFRQFGVQLDHSRPSCQAPRDNYKWYVLILVILTNMFVVAIPLMAMSVMAQEISTSLRLDLVQVGIIWGIGHCRVLSPAY